MGDNEGRPQNTEANRPSCPYPLVDHFPVPPTSENESGRDDTTHSNADLNIPVGMRSPYYGDRIILPEERSLIPGSNSEDATGNVQRNSFPSAPYMTRPQIAEQYAPAIGFTNLLAEPTDISPSVPPPSYDDLFETNNLTSPRASPRNGSVSSARASPRHGSVSSARASPRHGSVSGARSNTTHTAIVVPRTDRVPSSTVITHPRVQVIGTTSNHPSSNGCGSCATIAVVIFFMIIIFVYITRNSTPRTQLR